jgi:hypothetical protein
MRLTDRIRASLGQTEVAHFSCLNAAAMGRELCRDQLGRD